MTVTTSATISRARRRRALRRRHLSWWLFLLPSGIVLGTVMLYPLAYAIWLSLFNYDLGSGAHDFIGLGNYTALLADDRFGARWNAPSASCLPRSAWNSASAC